MNDSLPQRPEHEPSSRSNASFPSITSDSTIGIRFDRLAAEVRGSVISAALTTEAPPEIIANVSEELPTHLLDRIANLEQGSVELQELELLRIELSEIAIRISELLLQAAGRSNLGGQGFADSVLAIGVHGDGGWSSDRQLPAYHELVDAARIAERTGKTVISGFPDRDIAQGGIGGPMEVHGLWWLLADRNSRSGCRWRGLVSLHPHTTQFAVIGPINQHLKTQTFPSTEIGVGYRFLSEIAAEIAAEAGLEPTATAKNDLSTYSELASNGKTIHELEEIWHATATRDTHWNPAGASPLSLIYALKNSIYGNAQLEDLVATAMKFIATQVSNHVRHNIPASRPIGELFVTGEDKIAAELRSYMRQQLPEVPIRCASESGFEGTLYSASIAALALLHLWQIPLPSTAPGQIPRVLGKITPGSPSSWHHVLSVMNSNAPWLLPLREAI